MPDGSQVPLPPNPRGSFLSINFHTKGLKSEVRSCRPFGRKSLRRASSSSLYFSICNVYFSICNVYFSTCNVYFSICNAYFSTCNMYFSTCWLYFTVCKRYFNVCLVYFPICRNKSIKTEEIRILLPIIPFYILKLSKVK